MISPISPDIQVNLGVALALNADKDDPTTLAALEDGTDPVASPFCTPDRPTLT